jgi:hypothetical protein
MTNISKQLRKTTDLKQIIILSRITYQMRANNAPMVFEQAIILCLLSGNLFAKIERDLVLQNVWKKLTPLVTCNCCYK